MVKRHHYDSRDQLRAHLADFMAACKFARRFETLGGLTPDEYITKIRTSEPDWFTVNPIHQMPGPNAIAAVAQTKWEAFWYWTGHSWVKAQTRIHIIAGWCGTCFA